MPVTLKKNQIKYKDPSTGNYIGVDAVAERTTSEMVSEITTAAQTKINAINTAGTTQINTINTRATEVQASLPESGEMEDMVAVPFSESTAYPAGKYVIQNVSGVNKLYKLPEGHAAGTTWANTTKVGPLNLGDETADLKSAIDYSAELFGFLVSPTLTNGYYISANGTKTETTASWMYTSPIELKKDYTITAYARGYSVNIAIISKCASDGTSITPIVICTDDVRRNYSYKATEDCYVIISGNNPAIDPGPTNIVITPNYDFLIKDAIYQGSVSVGYYINAQGVVTESSGGWDITDYLNVDGAKFITYGGLTNVGSANVNSAWYDSSKSLLQNGVFKHKIGTNTINVPDGACYVRFSIANAEKSDFFVNAYSEPQHISLNNWELYTWALIGDSLTHKNYRAVYSYYDYIKNDTGINLINKGQSGGGYARGNAFYQEISALENETFDFATFFGSGNDCNWQEIYPNAQSWEEALGTVTDTTTDTICGYINRAINRYYNLFPLKKLGIITPTPWNAYSNADGTITGTIMDDYVGKLIQICKMRGIPCLDLYHESGLRPWNSDFRLEYYNEGGEQDSGTHPNSKGHKWFYPMIMEFLKQFIID